LFKVSVGRITCKGGQLPGNLVFSIETDVEVSLELWAESLHHVVELFRVYGRGCLFQVSVEALSLFVLDYLLGLTSQLLESALLTRFLGLKRGFFETVQALAGLEPVVPASILVVLG